jgi:hypothetical protein
MTCENDETPEGVNSAGEDETVGCVGGDDLESDLDTLSEFSMCDSATEMDIIYILIVVGLIIAAVLVVSNFVYWFYTMVKFGYAGLPGFLKPLAVTGWLVPPLGVLLSCGAEFASETTTTK